MIDNNPRRMEHLGDGLCADFDGERVRLFTPQQDGILEVYISQPVLLAFLSYVAKIGFWEPIAPVNEAKPAADERRDDGE